MLYYIIDLEFNQYFDFNTENDCHPEPACPAEIIQIGVVVADHNLEVQYKLSTFVKPKIYKRLHPYVQRMTGITPALLRNAPAFTDVYEDFFSFAFGKRAVFCTWGSDDVKELYRNILFYGLDHKCLPRRYLNVQRMYDVARKGPAAEGEEESAAPSQQTGLKTAIELSGLPVSRPFHNALSDAEYTTDILKYLMDGKDITECAQVQSLNLGDLKENITGRVNAVNIKLLYIHAERLLQRKLSERDKSTILDIYKLGRSGRFDTVRRKNPE